MLDAFSLSDFPEMAFSNFSRMRHVLGEGYWSLRMAIAFPDFDLFSSFFRSMGRNTRLARFVLRRG